ncbi:MAG TPA: hypothetical protein VL993_15560 [Stellaceae bacterium]|nr:hypothetical protein [Stellaceae bacterium]
MRGRLLALLPTIVACAAHAEGKPLPQCSGLIAAVRSDPSSILNGSSLLNVEKLVADLRSNAETRICTGVADYRDATTHITYTAKWLDESQTAIDVNAHPTTVDEAKGRALALRQANHPKGETGIYELSDYTPYCTDADFLAMATKELHYGISVGAAFYREPGYRIFDITPNGPGAGILANCVATVGDDKTKGQIFIGTNWVNIQAATQYQFYILDTGPEGFKLTDRLWDLATE